MPKYDDLILVSSHVLPEVFSKVLEAKQLLSEGLAKNIMQAVQTVGISRSAFYKYKDSVFPFNQMHGILTLSFVLLDVQGVLSAILSELSKAGANILTINQNIPVSGTANMTITVQTDAMRSDLHTLIDALGAISGVRSIEVLAKQ